MFEGTNVELILMPALNCLLDPLAQVRGALGQWLSARVLGQCWGDTRVELLMLALICLLDPLAQVRWAACEALYNIAKVLRDKVLVFFSEIFDALCKLTADTDTDTREASHVLDRLLKDIVTEHDANSVDIDKVITLREERMHALDAEVGERQY